MGGLGSGNRHRFDKKTTTGETLSLDVRYLHREGMLKAGRWFSLRWSRGDRETGSVGGAVTGGERAERVVLSYRHRGGAAGEWEDVRETVPLEWTPCNFGGERPWFLCPGSFAGCGRRVAVLYAPGRHFLCRRCYDLCYQSQREDGTYRALHKAQAIRERLGGSADMTEPFPRKPKGMHRRTYDRLWWEHHEAETEQLAGMRAWLDGMQRKIG